MIDQLTPEVDWRKARLVPRTKCPLCNSLGSWRQLGVRGNREHWTADPEAEPHVWVDVVRCGTCDYFFTDPAIEGLEELERQYYSDVDRYAAFGDHGGEDVIRRRLAWLGRASSGRLLDVGAGTGEFARVAAEATWEVVGVEPSESFCAHARQHGVSLIHGTLEDWEPDQSHPFDVVTLNHVLEHVPVPIALLKQAAKHLKPGGRILIEVPNSDSYFLRLADLYLRLRGLHWSTRLSPLHPPFHSFGFSRRSLEFALRQSGFTVQSVRFFGGADRGYRTDVGWLAPVRAGASRLLQMLGNAELLAIIGRLE